MRLNVDLTTRLLHGFVREEVAKVGFERVVVALSGGIDSALTAYLAVAALGPDRVRAIMLPYRTSKPASLGDAHRVVEALDIDYRIFEITPMAEAYFDWEEEMTPKRRGNVMARARMIAVYDQSETFDALVVGTSNKTELLLGYGTLWGDMASALNPIGDLYKTQVRQLAAALGVPKAILDKPPSADLWEGQSDEGELGFTYEQVDQLLYLLIDERYAADELIEDGIDPAFVQRVQRLVQGSQFKRQLPLIAKVSQRTIDRDFLYLRDWGR
ncbi:MAG: NAD(+) synthetase [Dehalococcoidia bacterium]|nr:NAD(+) synthetase [Dehalococcoidia bacterium]